MDWNTDGTVVQNGLKWNNDYGIKKIKLFPKNFKLKNFIKMFTIKPILKYQFID